MNLLNTQKPLIKEWPVAIIILVGFLLRIKGLTHQSLWVDELHTMMEADPRIPWKQMLFYLKTCDQHPPLFFTIERFSFALFGHTEFVARFVSVLAGTISIWAMYKLGIEVLSKRLGLIAALLTCINYFVIEYSQEARPYIFAFLFATLSYTWFIRLVKSPSRRNTIIYSVFTLLLLYSHYFSLFIAASQAVLALLFIFLEKGEGRKILFRNFLLAGIIVIIGYLPWSSFLLEMTQIKSFWLQDVSPAFLQNFFFEFFGNSDLLKPLLLLLLFVYIAHISFTSREKEFRNNPLLFSFIIFLSWIFITVLIPYIRSLLTVPMLLSRYTIVILPAILLILAWSIELFKEQLVKYAVAGLFVLVSLTHLFFVKNYYHTARKSQFREITRFIVDNNEANYPVINELTLWHQTYYLNRDNSKAVLISGSKDKAIDSILSHNATDSICNGFWIAGAHGDKKPGEDILHRLDSGYTLVKQIELFDAWARLYTSNKCENKSDSVINFSEFTGGSVLADQGVIAIWNGSISSRSMVLSKGNYSLLIRANGTEAAGEYPHLNIYINNKKIGDYYTTSNLDDKEIRFENATDGSIILKLEMDNDFNDARGDRNVFVKQIRIRRSGR